MKLNMFGHKGTFLLCPPILSFKICFDPMGTDRNTLELRNFKKTCKSRLFGRLSTIEIPYKYKVISFLPFGKKKIMLEGGRLSLEP